jgi:hypothetical protein
MKRYHGRHPECGDCKFFRRNTGHVRCLPCGAGEFFEEKAGDREPSDAELMILFSHMDGSYDDDN